ncbi:serine/threonine protein kinase, partial [Candidatus Woesearchaeota archaeon]|nr:serine/threonine protein kinase [Candidatus Woesearchaeota archaeon]
MANGNGNGKSKRLPKNIEEIIDRYSDEPWFESFCETVDRVAESSVQKHSLVELTQGEFTDVMGKIQKQYQFLGDAVGQFRLVAALGKGGFGEVYVGMRDFSVMTEKELLDFVTELRQRDPAFAKKTAKFSDKQLRAQYSKLYQTKRDAVVNSFQNTPYARAKFAIKILPPELYEGQPIIDEKTRETEDMRRFRREAQTLQELQKIDPERARHIVKVSDFGVFWPSEESKRENKPVYFYAMEILPGEMEYNKELDQKQVIEWIAQAATGLSLAHDEGILHRDLKEENIRLAEESGKLTAKVTDFGLLKQMNPSQESLKLTAKDTVMGTLWYMSPEQARGEKLDERADVYSLGVVLYHMLTDKYQCNQDKIQQQNALLAMLASDPDIIDPRKYNKKIPQALVDILTKATAPHKEERYLSMRAFENDLRKFLAREKIDVDLSQLKRRQWDEKHPVLAWIRKHKWVSGAAAAGLAALLSATAYFAVRGPEKTAEQVRAEQLEKTLQGHEKTYSEIRSLYSQGNFADAYRKILELEKVLGNEKAFQKLAAKVKGDVPIFHEDSVVARYETSFRNAEALSDPEQRERQIEAVFAEIDKDLQKNKGFGKLKSLRERKEKALLTAREDRFAGEANADYEQASQLERQGLLVEALGGYVAVGKKWQAQANLEKVAAVIARFSGKEQELVRRLLQGEGQNPVHKKLEFILTNIKARGDYRQVDNAIYRTLALLYAEKIVEPLAQGSVEEIPVAVKTDGTWLRQRMSELEWETKSAPAEFVGSLWQLYRITRNEEQGKKWLQYARRWMSFFDQVNEDTIDAYIGRALLNCHFTALELDPQNADQYKKEIQRLADLIVKKKWNEELGFLMQYMKESERNSIDSEVLEDAVALYKAYRLFGNQEYKEKADRTLEAVLKYNKRAEDLQFWQIVW